MINRLSLVTLIPTFTSVGQQKPSSQQARVVCRLCLESYKINWCAGHLSSQTIHSDDVSFFVLFEQLVFR